MHRDHFHQFCIAFETQFARIAPLMFILTLFRQIADQRVLAVELNAGLLQQFRKMQQVGQRTFVTTAEQTARHVEFPHQTAQHRQNALFAPAGTQRLKLLNVALPLVFILIEPVQRFPAQVQRRCREGRAQ